MSGAIVQALHRTGDPYPVLLGKGLLRRVGPRLRRLWGTRRVAVITQRKLDRLFGRQLRASLSRSGLDAVFLFMPEGERFKNLGTVERLYQGLLRHRIGREDGLVALGGGVVGDTAGFAAATFLRGVQYVQLPTTLLAQIDSSLGAKVGINLAGGKNLAGAIYRPSAVWIDPDLLTTLPAREFRSGLFEMLKYGFIGSPSLFRDMELSPSSFKPSSRALEWAIASSARMKLRVVRLDERESGLRRILNFGHTMGHGLEAAGDFMRLSHGEAVGWGIIAACRLAHRRRLIGQPLAERMEAAVRNLAPLPSLERLRVDRVLRAVDRDKKIGPRGLRFVLPIALGRVTVVEGIPRDQLRWALQSLGVGRSTP